jgi:two-component system, LytTR family, sensor kinase
MESGPGDNQLLSPAPFIWFVEPFISRNRPVAGFLFRLPGHRDTVSTNLNIGELLNLVGLSTGVVLYTMLLAMVIRAARPSGGTAHVDPLLLLTSILGLVWNLCALPVYELPKIGLDGPVPFLAAIGFGALGFLPAVVVHSVLRGAQDDVRGVIKHTLAIVAYGVSAIAALLHLVAMASGTGTPSPLGMRLLTYTFVALVVPLAAVTRGQPGARRALWAAALAVFAVSALHLSQLHKGEASWPVELVGHHASLPLALAILYQDYPFALADLFLKRALALLALVTIAFVTIATFGVGSAAFAQLVARDPREVGILVTLWVGTALMYPALRRTTAWFVDAIVLHRPDYPSLRASIAQRIQTHDDVSSLLSDVCERLAPALSSQSVTWGEWHPAGDDDTAGQLVLWGRDAAIAPVAHPVAAVVIVPASEAPRYAITLGGLTGGRRVLSDDVTMLETVAVAVARRIDAIRISNERHQREIREREIGKLASEAELRALRAQINPHFLFNALTTIGYLIQTAPPRALRTLLRLTTLLRGVLRSEGEFTTLGRELEIIESYLDIERARFDERLRVSIDVPARLHHVRVPPLILQPLVENAVKHGISHKELGGDVTIRAWVARADGGARELVLSVQDTGAGTTPSALQRGRNEGVGLRNIERRLDYQYGPSASLSIESAAGIGTLVVVRLPVTLTVADPARDRAVV